LFVQILGHVRALDPTTGALLWTSPPLDQTAGLHWQSPIVINGRVYAVDNASGIFAWGLPRDSARVTE
jgi:hypothetical protein